MFSFVLSYILFIGKQRVSFIRLAVFHPLPNLLFFCYSLTFYWISELFLTQSDSSQQNSRCHFFHSFFCVFHPPSPLFFDFISIFRALDRSNANGCRENSWNSSTSRRLQAHCNNVPSPPPLSADFFLFPPRKSRQARTHTFSSSSRSPKRERWRMLHKKKVF